MKDYKKKALKSYQNLSKEEKKSDNMAINDTKVSQTTKNKSLLSIKKYYRRRKNATLKL